MPGFPSYCADSLLMITSSSTGCRCSCIGHYVFLHTPPDNRPNQVRLRYVPSTSYRFLQTPPLASDALASRIQFPMNRAWSLTSSDWVCQLRWANKKTPALRTGVRSNFASILVNDSAPQLQRRSAATHLLRFRIDRTCRDRSGSP